MRRARLLERFLPRMQHELDANSFKGDDWHTRPPADLSHDILYHAAKLHLAVDANDTEAIAELSADVANCAGILFDALDCHTVYAPEIILVDGAIKSEDMPNMPGSRFGSRDLKEHVDGWCRELDVNPGRWTRQPDPEPAEEAA